MKEHLVRHGLGLAILLILLGHASRVYEIDLIRRLDAIAYDATLGLTLRNEVDDRIVIVDIDERSLAEVGRWPWGRDRMAALLDNLFDRYGAALVGFDVVLAEPDHSSGLNSLDRLAEHELRDDAAFQRSLRQLRPQLDYDGRLARALGGRPVVLGYYLSSTADAQGMGALPAPTLPAGSFRGRPAAITHWTSFGGNLPRFQRNAAAAGHMNPMFDSDSIVRRVPMLAEFGGNYYESLSLAVVRTLLGFPEVVPGHPESGSGMIEWLDLATEKGALRIPVDEHAAALIPYRGRQGSFARISAADLLAARVPPEKLRGRVALVGTTAPGLVDLRATPVEAAYPGVEIHANLIAGMLDGTIKHRPGYMVGAEVLLLIAIGAVMILLQPRLSPLRGSLVTLAALLTLCAINLALWHFGNLVLPLAAGITLIATLYAVNMSWGYFVESRDKRQFADLFGQYVPPELVDEMARNPQNYSMGGRKAELTVLFSDIRGFTSMSEGMEPEQVAALMNEYLGDMTAIIRRHRGTLDKYIGDAIMAFWGAPVSDPHHARQAVLSAMEMQGELSDLNRRLAGRGWPELRIGIGINTGLMTVGDMGSPVRKAYTVIGDAVNLASRLEGITKEYGIGIIVGERTREVLAGEFVFREVDRVRVRGKGDSVAIFEPVSLAGQVDPRRQDDLRLWNQMLRAYRAQEWDQAELGLMNLSRLAEHPLYDIYQERIGHCRRHPPGKDWDGVWVFETK